MLFSAMGCTSLHKPDPFRSAVPITFNMWHVLILKAIGAVERKGSGLQD